MLIVHRLCIKYWCMLTSSQGSAAVYAEVQMMCKKNDFPLTLLLWFSQGQ